MENQILEELKKLNSRFDNLETRFDNLEEDLRGFKQEVSDKFDAMDQRFNAIDQRLDSIEKYSRDAVDILIELSKRTVSIEQYQKLKKQVDLNTKDIHELRLKIG
ncbi:hypothetical protein [Filifactor alocis]|uniref:hypothetical protein n=1 Tax=Filifactor alocis TaxID=143361 RepID=UPI0028EFF65F|nr:hypothetical protein [Filifactor alocis]